MRRTASKGTREGAGEDTGEGKSNARPKSPVNRRRDWGGGEGEKEMDLSPLLSRLPRGGNPSFPDGG